jgi:hypothetical protein
LQFKHLYILAADISIMAGTEKNVLAVLLIITMFISLVGTIAAVMVMTSQGGYREIPTAKAGNEDAGKVSAYLVPPPSEMTGRVAAYVVPSEGGV